MRLYRVTLSLLMVVESRRNWGWVLCLHLFSTTGWLHCFSFCPTRKARSPYCHPPSGPGEECLGGISSSRGTGQVLLLTLLRLLLLSRGEGRCRRRDGRGCWCSQGDQLSASVHKTLPKQRQLRVTSAWGLSGTPVFPEKLHVLSV